MKEIITKLKKAAQDWWRKHRERIRELFFKALKFCWNFGMSLIIFVAFLGIVVLPFMDECFTKWTALIVWIVSGVIVVACDIALTVKVRTRIVSDKDLTGFGDLYDVFSSGGSTVLLPVFGTFLVTRYFQTSYNWWWGAAVILLVIAIVGPLKMYQLVRIFTDYPKERMQQIKKALVKTLLFYIIVDVFYIAAFNGWNIAFFIFGIIALSIQLANVSTSFLKQNLKLKLFLAHDFIVAILLTIYLIYSIPNADLKEIVLAIVSAVYGGFIALVGVAWTIKDGQHRDADAKRLEKMPYLKVDFGDFELKDKNGKDRFADRYLDIEKSDNESFSFGMHGIVIANIGLGMATNLAYNWKDNGEIDNTGLPLLLIRCDETLKQNIQFMAEKVDQGSKTLRKMLQFSFDDILGNHYIQNLDVIFEISHESIAISGIEMYAPEYVEEDRK